VSAVGKCVCIVCVYALEPAPVYPDCGLFFFFFFTLAFFFIFVIILSIIHHIVHSLVASTAIDNNKHAPPSLL
jgi:hypothetical protein